MTGTWRFMLDTDTVSYVIRDVGEVASRLLEHHPSEVCISTVTLGELRFGANKRRSKRLHHAIDAFTTGVEVAPFDVTAATMFGRVRAHLETRGVPIGILDTMIAAHALALDVTLVTNNTKHFSQVRGLRTANWSKD
jgi:tRNA(fMet)-specific endonuclease VapC